MNGVTSSVCVLCVFLQELEMQARAHGLAVVSSPSVCTSELMARAIKQEPVLCNCPSDSYHHASGPDMSPPTTLDLNNGTISFDQIPSDAGDPGPYGSSKTCKMTEMVGRDATLSPIAPNDPLLSSVSPDGSDNNSRCSSSSSMEEREHGC